MRFSLLIRHLREERGLTYRAAGKLTGVKFTQISSLEKGERNPTLSTIYKLSIGYNFNPKQMFEAAIVEMKRNGKL